MIEFARGHAMTCEDVPMPPVERYCQRCSRTYGYTSPRQWTVVSPTGTAHIGADFGLTACGIDATGDLWWWAL